MTHIITRACCNDAACVPVCPVNCIHPTPDDPDFGTAEMLYIDPAGCIDCGACVEVCPVEAIYSDHELPTEFARFQDFTVRYYEGEGRAGYTRDQRQLPERPWEPNSTALKVAIVGSGPAACYAAEEIAGQRGLQTSVDIFERLMTPGGLVRYGVAPDHRDTKRASEAFERTMQRPNVRVFFNTEVGVDITHDQLAERYHAVIYAVGAMSDRGMAVPGESLPGSHSAPEFVAWYNGHPDFADRLFDLSSERVVVIGNGNVALDVARILLTPAEHLERTDIAAHALAALRESKVREVVVLGRRGPLQAAFTAPELLGLAEVDGVDIVVRPDEVNICVAEPTVDSLKVELLTELGVSEPASERSIALRFLGSPEAILGDDHVTAIRVARNRLVDRDGAVVAEPTGEVEELSCGLVLRSVGYRGQPIRDLPFDERRAVIPHINGRVMNGGQTMPGVYVTGWIKRGPSGVIGTNKKCARETAAALLDDFRDQVLADPKVSDDIAATLVDAVDLAGWRRIAARERELGRQTGRPQVKLVEPGLIRAVADGEASQLLT